MSLKRAPEPLSLILYYLAIDTILFVDSVKVAEVRVPSSKATSYHSMLMLTFQQIGCVDPILISASQIRLVGRSHGHALLYVLGVDIGELIVLLLLHICLHRIPHLTIRHLRLLLIHHLLLITHATHTLLLPPILHLLLFPKNMILITILLTSNTHSHLLHELIAAADLVLLDLVLVLAVLLGAPVAAGRHGLPWVRGGGGLSVLGVWLRLVWHVSAVVVGVDFFDAVVVGEVDG